jgi:hypothetical protein
VEWREAGNMDSCIELVGISGEGEVDPVNNVGTSAAVKVEVRDAFTFTAG